MSLQCCWVCVGGVGQDSSHGNGLIPYYLGSCSTRWKVLSRFPDSMELEETGSFEDFFAYMESLLLEEKSRRLLDVKCLGLIGTLAFGKCYVGFVVEQPDLRAVYAKCNEWINLVMAQEDIQQVLKEMQTVYGWTGKVSSGINSEGSVSRMLGIRRVADGVEIHISTDEKKLPRPGEKNYLITSALPYVNNVPHLGNIIGCVLSADAFARYCRLRAYNALYICGTDEYGTATETKAIEENMDCRELCSKYYKLHADIYEWFGIDFDIFGRTSTPLQTEIAQDIFLELHKNGYMQEDVIHQWYCETCNRFLADRYVEGTCPLCGYNDARGDQCDKCGRLLNAIDLKDARCKLDRSLPVIRMSNHMFLDLPELQSACEKFVDMSNFVGKWSSNALTITKSWLKEGLKPRCVTRDLKWGVPVPLDHMKDKVFYVWFDATIGYISITANHIKEWEMWWKNPKDVLLYQFMGKDNVPFHTIIFPAVLIGTGRNYTLLHHVNTTEYLNYEDSKFSKSRGIGVFGNDARETGIPADVWRFYLFSNRPETSDSVFTWADFVSKTNHELLANLGNFVNRSLKFLKNKYAGILAEVHLIDNDREFMKRVQSELSNYIAHMESVELKDGLRCAMAVSRLGNLYLTDNKLDNKLFDTDPQRCGTVVNVTINLVYLLSALIYPFMPQTTEHILSQLNAPLRRLPDEFKLDLLPGHEIGVPAHLFSRIDESMIEVYRVRYGGSQTTRSTTSSAK